MYIKRYSSVRVVELPAVLYSDFATELHYLLSKLYCQLLAVPFPSLKPCFDAAVLTNGVHCHTSKTCTPFFLSNEEISEESDNLQNFTATLH